jgi:SNF2 family DNA or RNA helicase
LPLVPITLKSLSELTSLESLTDPNSIAVYDKGRELLFAGAFDRYIATSTPPKALRVNFFWLPAAGMASAIATVTEDQPGGNLQFHCQRCESTDENPTCPHAWATLALLFECTAQRQMEPKVKYESLSTFLTKAINGETIVSSSSIQYSEDIKLESISFCLPEKDFFTASGISELTPDEIGPYHRTEVRKEDETPAPALWHLPEIFRKNIHAFSDSSRNETQKIYKLVDVIRYNFSNGVQFSAKDILRHALHKNVPRELLPTAKSGAINFERWALLQEENNLFTSQNVNDIEEIMQDLISRIVLAHRAGNIEVYLQSPTNPHRALAIKNFIFDASEALVWRAEFTERDELESEFKLMAKSKNQISYFESFALEHETATLIAHPWIREFSALTTALNSSKETLYLSSQKVPTFQVTGELETKLILNHLRQRKVKVELIGSTIDVEASQGRTEIHFKPTGHFYIQHQIKVSGQKNIVRRGWSTRTTLLLHSLSQGLTYLLNSEAKEVATRTRSKREWDIKILKNLGIIQYITFECLHLHFNHSLSDQRESSPEQLFSMLHKNIQKILVGNSSGIYVRQTPLAELCSRSVLSCFEDFVNIIFNSLSMKDSFFSEEGEVTVSGIVERELRLVFELLGELVEETEGDLFRKSRSAFLDKICSESVEHDPELRKLWFHFPYPEIKKESILHRSLENCQHLISHGFKIFLNDQAIEELSDEDFTMDFEVNTDTQNRNFNWFELNPKFFLHGVEVDSKNLTSLGGSGVLEYEGKLYLVPQKQIPSLKRLEKFWQRLQKGKTENARKKASDSIYQLPRHQTLELLALRASGVKIRGDFEWNQLCEFYDKLGHPRDNFEIPSSTQGELKQYQKDGVRWLDDLYRLRLGALLADDMGLGKTIQTLCFLDILRNQGDLGSVLIVVPSSLVYNWQQEVAKFTPELPLKVFSSRERNAIGIELESKRPNVVLVTYGLLMENEDFLNQYNWKVLIFDEAQNLKNISTKRTNAARSLKAQYKICLTGTPMENHYGEFYSLVDLLVPGSLGKIEEFRRQYVNADQISREEIDDLKLKIKPLLLRRSKKEILDQLPEKQETKVSIAFEDRQKEIYRDIALSYNQKIQESLATKGEASVQLQMLTALLRLRQACSDPAALPNVKYDKVPPKLETLIDSVSEIVESGESALVFTQFIQTLEHTIKLLKQKGIAVFALHGALTTKQRQSVLSDFENTKGGAVLVMTLKTGGVGLNLTKASYVFHLEPWWNPSVENQATDRAHRLGQTKAVQVFKYIMHESLEEKIELLKGRKDEKFKALFSNTEKETEISETQSHLSKADFDLLIGLK